MKCIVLTKKAIVRTAMCVAAGVFAISGICVLAGNKERLLPIYSVETSEKKIAITFDAAWGNEDTTQLISILKAHNAKATFFMTGEFIDKFPDDVKLFHQNGHEIGNHSDKHPHITKLDQQALKKDIEACNQKIEALTSKPCKIYRGPYGEYDNQLIQTLAEQKSVCIQWDVDSRDWQKKSVDQMVEAVTKSVKNGSIVLFHNGVENTPRALDQILTNLEAQGYSFVSVSELIYHDNYRIDQSGRQISLHTASSQA